MVFDRNGCFKYWVKTAGDFVRDEGDTAVETTKEQIEELQQGDNFWRLMYDGVRCYVDESKKLPVDCEDCF